MTIGPIGPAGVRFEDLPEQAWPRHEIIDGSLYVSPLAGVPHQAIVTRLAIAMAKVAPPELEVLAGVNVLHRTQTDRALIPDVVVIDATVARPEAGASVRPEDVFLAAEVISPSSRATDLHLKRQLYAEWGIGSYWVLDPQAREVHEFGLRESATCWLAEIDVASIWLKPSIEPAFDSVSGSRAGGES